VKIIESRHENEPWLMYWLGNVTAIDSDVVKSVGIAWLFRENGVWVSSPRATGNKSLFFNSVFFIRLSIPAGIFLSIRWSSSDTKKSIWQSGIGWKLNGRLAILFRFQSDKSSAKGVTGPNYGQATGFNYGTH